MTLFNMCIKILAKPEIIDTYKNQLEYVPVPIKTALLTLLCKRGYFKSSFIFKKLINPDIYEIDLSECEISDDFLSCLYVCKNLKKLDLSLRRKQQRHITTEGLITLFPHLTLLKVIIIPYCKEVNDQVVETICLNCKELIELHIPNSEITDYSFYIIGKHLKHLTILNILGTQISDVGIGYLIDKNSLSHSLVEINIDKCQNISSQCSINIAKRCPNIKIFTCGSLDDLEEAGFAMNIIRSKAKQIFWRL